MRTVLFLLVLVLLLAAGVFAMFLQQRQVASLRAQLVERSWQVSTSPAQLQPKPVLKPGRATEESQLLRLRGEVSLLQRDLNSVSAGELPRRKAEDDWAMVYSGVKPSAYPDFMFLTNCGSVGFSTPASALQSFYFAMLNQIKEPLTPTRMKQLWDVPDDFDDPGARYSIDIGEGMGGEDGYRVVSQEQSGSNGVRMTLEFEHPDGSAFRRNVTLLERNGLWRMKPAQVSRPNPGQ